MHAEWKKKFQSGLITFFKKISVRCKCDVMQGPVLTRHYRTSGWLDHVWTAETLSCYVCIFSERLSYIISPVRQSGFHKGCHCAHALCQSSTAFVFQEKRLPGYNSCTFTGCFKFLIVWSSPAFIFRQKCPTNPVSVWNVFWFSNSGDCVLAWPADGTYKWKTRQGMKLWKLSAFVSAVIASLLSISLVAEIFKWW